MSIWIRILRTATRAVQTALVFSGLLFVSACSHKALSLMFDLPPPPPEEETQVTESASGPGMSDPLLALLWQGSGEQRPAVEGVQEWEQALQLLPTDDKGNVDWSAAVREGDVRPRARQPEDLLAKSFQMDFVLPAEKPKFDAWFPHSAHTEWLGCRNCHGTIFKYASNNEMTMKEMRAGAFCGACHNQIAFSLKECGRCHLAMKK